MSVGKPGEEEKQKRRRRRQRQRQRGHTQRLSSWDGKLALAFRGRFRPKREVRGAGAGVPTHSKNRGRQLRYGLTLPLVAQTFCGCRDTPACAGRATASTTARIP